MYEDFFDLARQEAMRNYFLNTLSKLGRIKKYNKNELINIDFQGYVAIVVKGVVIQSIISLKGQEKLLYIIRPGEILGEMIYFCGGTDSIIGRAKDEVEISILSGETIEEELIKTPYNYKYFMHSITRKFRIVTLQLTGSIFNDSRGQIADALLRLSSTSDPDYKGRTALNYIYTHEQLAKNIGCSRITVTRHLSEFVKENIISYEDKKIIINEPDILKKYIDIVIGE